MKKQLLFALAIFLTAIFTTSAQIAPTIIADGFVNGLIGVEVDSAGNIWLTEFGNGNDDAQITILDPAGNKTLFMTGLPSAVNPLTGEIAGAFRTCQMPNNKVLIVVGEGPHAQAEALLIVDKSDFNGSTPLTLANVELTNKLGDFVHDQGFLQSDPYNVAWDGNGNFFIADAGANSILKMDASGALSIVVTMDGIPNPLPFGPPVSDAVPTDIVPKPDGSGHYVCNLTGFPFLDSAATIFNLDNAGNLTPWATGFTCLTDMGYDPKDGELCVLQFAKFGEVDTTLNFIPGTGEVIKVKSDGSRETIAAGIIGLAPSFTFDAAGDLYVTDLFGFVYKYDFPTDASEVEPLSAHVQVYPNPFSDKVTLRFELDSRATVQAFIHDLQGKIVKQFSPAKQESGTHSLQWSGEGVAPGLYIYRIIVDGQLSSGFLHLAK